MLTLLLDLSLNILKLSISYKVSINVKSFSLKSDANSFLPSLSPFIFTYAFILGYSDLSILLICILSLSYLSVLVT